jgi:YVTN family beta-propeller protein
MHFNADHTKLYIACGDDDVIAILDVATLKIVAKLKTGSSPEAFAIDQTRRRIYVSPEEASSLAVIDMDRGAILKEVPTGGEPEGVLVSEDGKTVYVTSEAGDLVHEVDTASGAITRDVVVGLRHAASRRRQTVRTCGSRQSSLGATYIVDRAEFVVTGSVPFLPPGIARLT